MNKQKALKLLISEVRPLIESVDYDSEIYHEINWLKENITYAQERYEENLNFDSDKY